MPFPQALAGARRILGGWRRSGWFWCYGRSCWWCSRRMTKRSSPTGSGRGRRGPVREGYKVVALLLKPSLFVGRCRKLCFHHQEHVPVIRGNPAMVLAVVHLVLAEVLFVWKEPEPVQRCISDLSLNIVSLSDMIEGYNRSWDLYTTGQLVEGLPQKKKTGFH